MKTFLKIDFILIFSLVSAIFAILLFTKLNGFTKEDLKTKLAEANTYSKAVDEIYKQIDKTLTDDNSDQAAILIAPMIKKEITPQYLQDKTEKFIDDTNDWMTGKNNSPPVLSFKDLKEKILAENASTITLLEQLNKEYEQQKNQLRNEAGISGEIPQDQQLPSFDLNKIIKSDFSIPVGKNLGFLKTFYWLSTSGVIFIGVFLSILLIMITLLNSDNPSKLKWIGLTFLSSAVWNILLLLTLLLTSKSLIEFLNQNKDIPSIIVLLSNNLIPPLTDKYAKFAGTIIILFTTIFIVFLIAFIISKNSQIPYQTKRVPPKKN